jgi:hypothetical protein
MAAVLTPEQLFNFLFAFAGQTVTVPDQKTILASFRDLDIFFSLVDSPTPAEIQSLASKYGTTIQTVKSVAFKVSEVLQKPCPIK